MLHVWAVGVRTVSSSRIFRMSNIQAEIFGRVSADNSADATPIPARHFLPAYCRLNYPTHLCAVLLNLDALDRGSWGSCTLDSASSSGMA